MQVIDSSAIDSNDNIIKPSRILALPYIETESGIKTESEDIEIKEPVKKITREERRKARNEFLGKNNIEKNVEPEIQPEQMSYSNDPHSDYDGKLIFQWMRRDFDRIREKIEYCESPPISDYPEENMRIAMAVENYKEKGSFRDADKIKDYIESLMWYGKVNEGLFGQDDYILKETIEGYKEIHKHIVMLKDKGEGDEVLRLLNKLILCGARPLVVDETLMKETQYEPSSSEGGVYGGEFNQEEDGI